jgi:hypothetical protein
VSRLFTPAVNLTNTVTSTRAASSLDYSGPIPITPDVILPALAPNVTAPVVPAAPINIINTALGDIGPTSTTGVTV